MVSRVLFLKGSGLESDRNFHFVGRIVNGRNGIDDLLNAVRTDSKRLFNTNLSDGQLVKVYLHNNANSLSGNRAFGARINRDMSGSDWISSRGDYVISAQAETGELVDMNAELLDILYDSVRWGEWRD